MNRAVRNFHLPLPEPTYRRLRDAAQRANQPATVVARYAIESWLRQQRKAALHEAVSLPAGSGGLTKPGVALCHQVTTLDRSKLGNRIGALSPDPVAGIDVRLRAALSLD